MNENAHLFVCCRIPLDNISLELSSFQVKGCKLRLSVAAFEQGYTFIVPHDIYCDTGLRFSSLVQRITQFNRILRQANDTEDLFKT